MRFNRNSMIINNPRALFFSFIGCIREDMHVSAHVRERLEYIYRANIKDTCAHDHVCLAYVKQIESVTRGI